MVIGNRKASTIFFDMDGTLVDSMPALYKAYLAFLHDYGITGNEQEFHQLNGPSLSEVVSILKKRYDLPFDKDSLLKSYLNNVIGFYAEESAPHPGADNLLKELRFNRCSIYLVTSAEKAIVKNVLDKLQWNDVFTNVITGSDVKDSKPSGDIYRLALSMSGAEPKDVIVFEDSQNGILAGKDAGLFVVGIAHVHRQKELIHWGADMVVPSFNRFLS